jgi:uracil-DNA glycosylase
MNEELRQLYEQHWNGLSEAITELKGKLKGKEQPSNPLLIQLPHESAYRSADIRLMVFGQETNNWHSDFQGDMDKTLSWYSTFLEARRHKGKGSFWNGVRRFKKELEEEYPDKQVELVWNNVFKIGKQKIGKPHKSIREVELKHLNVLQKEIDILKPHLVIFFSGPNYDKQLFSKLKLQEEHYVDDGYIWREVAFGKLKNGVPFARTYHPSYLQRSKQTTDVFDYLLTILPELLNRTTQ